MEQENIIHLNDLFRSRAAYEALDFANISVSMTSSHGEHATIWVPSPERAAHFIKLFKSPHSPLERTVHRFPSGEFLEPIIFKAMGRYRNPQDKLERAVTAVRFRFSNEDSPSELCFNERYSLLDSAPPNVSHVGLSLGDLVKKFEKAGKDWSKVNFIEPLSPFNHTNHLKLVHQIK